MFCNNSGYIKDTLGDYVLAFYIAAGVSIYISLTTGVVALVIKKRKERHRRMMHDQTKVPYEKLK
jgi:hypothetical protein